MQLDAEQNSVAESQWKSFGIRTLQLELDTSKLQFVHNAEHLRCVQMRLSIKLRLALLANVANAA